VWQLYHLGNATCISLTKKNQSGSQISDSEKGIGQMWRVVLLTLCSYTHLHLNSFKKDAEIILKLCAELLVV